MKKNFTIYPTTIKASDEVPYTAEGKMSPAMAEFVTNKGRATISMFKKYGLLDYYDPMSGSATIYPRDFDGVKDKVLRLISENEEWILGYCSTASGAEEDFWFISDQFEM